jgi:hypothetical protein
LFRFCRRRPDSRSSTSNRTDGNCPNLSRLHLASRRRAGRDDQLARSHVRSVSFLLQSRVCPPPSPFSTTWSVPPPTAHSPPSPPRPSRSSCPGDAIGSFASSVGRSAGEARGGRARALGGEGGVRRSSGKMFDNLLNSKFYNKWYPKIASSSLGFLVLRSLCSRSQLDSFLLAPAVPRLLDSFFAGFGFLFFSLSFLLSCFFLWDDGMGC